MNPRPWLPKGAECNAPARLGRGTFLPAAFEVSESGEYAREDREPKGGDDAVD